MKVILIEAIKQEGWKRGTRWWFWNKRYCRCPYCAGLDDRDWLTICDCFMAEDKLE